MNLYLPFLHSLHLVSIFRCVRVDLAFHLLLLLCPSGVVTTASLIEVVVYSSPLAGKYNHLKRANSDAAYLAQPTADYGDRRHFISY